MSAKYEIGVIGLAVMGQNLVLNMESKGHRVAVYNRTTAKTEGFIKERAQDKKIKATFDLEELVAVLQKPRKIMLMVKAGAAVDIVIDKLLPYLEEGDIIIDGGNSYFKDTERRSEMLAKKGILYLGTGISGGEYGALHGPSIMPGGSKEAYHEVEEILVDISAKTEDGPCVTYLGPKSAGHYVKMVHNGIEYGVMQLIAEAYDLMRKVLAMAPPEMSNLFKKWNQEHQSYLLEITHEILEREDPETKKALVDVILDRAKQKGTGKWSTEEGLELGIPIPTMGAAVNARYFSALKDIREEISQVFPAVDKIVEGREGFLTNLENALFISIVTAYTEGMSLLQEASKEYEYGLNFAEIARIWEDGCIIRSALLKPIQSAFKREPELINLMIADQFKDEFKERIPGLRKVVAKAVSLGIPVPAFSSALTYFDSLKTENLPANLIQGQRDYFGAHTYERIDKEGQFHTEWQDIHNIT